VLELNALIPWREPGYLVEALEDAWNNITRWRKKDVPTSGTKDSSAFVLINFQGESQDAKLPRGMKSLLEKKEVAPVVCRSTAWRSSRSRRSTEGARGLATQRP
jgi:hypothetical protein